MNTKFTKGEWFHQKGDDWISDDSNDDRIICCAVCDGRSHEERRANALLIVAAPAMYKLLEKFLPMDGDGNGWDFVYDEGSEHMGEEVIALLSKARGES